MKPRGIQLFAIIALLSFLTITNAYSGSSYTGQKSSDETSSFPNANWQHDIVDTTAGADYLTQNERQVIIEINMVRTDPAGYARAFLIPIRKNYEGRLLQYPGETAIRTSEGLHALEECIKQLLSAKAVGVLTPKKGLTLAASEHANDQAKTGVTGHIGSDYSTPDKRVNRHGIWDLSAGENIDYGNGQAQRIVTSLLIDDGVPSRGHRKNLLSAKFNFVGVAVGPHPVFRNMCVMDFAGAYK